jgi:tetratricopeptide (TPR) repeat protein
MQTIKKQGGKLLVVGLFAAALLSGCKPPGARALLRGKDLLEAGRYAEAVEELTSAASLLPTNALAFNYLGLALHQAGQPAEAEKAYLRSLALNHELVEVRYNLGCLWLSEGKFDQARGEFTAFTLRRVNSPEGWLKLGTVQLRTREPAAAERSFQEALRLSPEDPEGLTGMGLARLQRNRPAEAAQWFSKALKQHPTYAPALLNLAIISQDQLNDKPQALQQYRQYLALKPPGPNAAAVQKVVEQLELELKPPPPVPPAPGSVVQKAPASNPATPAVRETPGTLSRQPPPLTNASPARTDAAGIQPKTHFAGETQRVTAPLLAPKPQPASETAKSSQPSPAAKPPPLAPQPTGGLELVQLANEPVFKTAQDSPMASPHANTAPERGSDRPTTPTNASKSATATQAEPMGASSEPGGTPLPAVARYRYKSPPKPVSGNRNQAERSFAQAVQAHRAQRLPEAMQAYRQATQIDPSYYDAYYNLGLAAMESGGIQTALAAYETALAIRPESLDARYNFALALKQANFPLDAANELNRLLSFYPNEGRAHLALGNLYAQQLGQRAKARQHYLQVLEHDPRNPQAGTIRYWLAENPR